MLWLVRYFSFNVILSPFSIAAVRQKVQQFLNAARTGNLDLLKSNSFTYFFSHIIVLLVVHDCFIYNIAFLFRILHLVDLCLG